jgi:hypothetical protein
VVAAYDDANLIVQLARWGTEMGLDEAIQVLFSGVLNQDLVLDLWWVAGLWARVGPAATKDRERIGQARLYENFEALAAIPST